MKKNLFALALIMTIVGVVYAQAPANTGYYYYQANGKKGAELKTALHQILKNPDVVHYDSLWNAYKISDARPMGDSLIIWDMYSDISRYRIDFPTHKNSIEGVSGFQREHSMPKSWFNPTERNSSGLTYADVKPMYSDIVHVIPTDGTVNNKRSNNAYGEITDSAKVDWQSANGFSKQSKKGGCGTQGWKEYLGTKASSARVFEPNNEYKGDLARIYFYMVTCYEPLAGTWTSDMFDAESEDGYQPFAQWAFDMLMRWAKEDPVSQKEIDRNEACYQLQGNRNPFVDYPGLEDYIWGIKKEVAFNYGGDTPNEGEPATNCEIILNEKTFGVDWTGNKNMRNYYTRTPLVASQNGIDIILSYGIEGSKLYSDSTHIRLYNKNVLTFRAHKNEITSIEFTIPAKADDKELIPLTGQMDGNTWRGQAQEVLFTSTYTSSWPESNANKHIQISGVKITVAAPSGITQHTSDPKSQTSTIYDLQGRRVAQPTKGMYIKNERKFIVK